jgi:hypothetical protein
MKTSFEGHPGFDSWNKELELGLINQQHSVRG